MEVDMRKVTVLQYSWFDDYTGQELYFMRVFGSRKAAERFAQYVIDNYGEGAKVELTTCTVE